MQWQAIVLVVGTGMALMSAPVVAHGTAERLEVVAGEYTAVLEYDPLDMTAKDLVPLAFELTKKETKELVVPASVFVRIEKDNRTLLSVPITRNALGNYSLSFTFPDAGGYTLTGRYEDEEGKTIADATFSVTVNSPYDRTWSLPYQEGLVGGLLGFVLGYLLFVTLQKPKR